jgi:hypothetical protein
VTKRVAYISGPIAGQPDLNGALFRAAERRLKNTKNLRKFRYDLVLVPHDIPPFLHEGECPPSYVKNGDHTAACYLRTDLSTMLLYATDVWMLPGWEASVGARLEMQVAAACGLAIKFFHPGDLGCAHIGYEEGKCDEEPCWNYCRTPDLFSAARRLGEAHTVLGATMTPVTARKIASMACVHPLTQFGNEAFCKVEHCPNYYARNGQ